MIVVTYFNTFLFSFIWRVVLIRYADRGLVLDGRPNTQLLKQLYWIIFTSLASINILHFPIQKVISGTFQETISGKVCLLQTFTLVNDVSRKTFIGAQIFPFLVNLFNLYLSFKVGEGLCLCKDLIRSVWIYIVIGHQILSKDGIFPLSRESYKQAL